MYEFAKCHDEIVDPKRGDPPCAPRWQIKNWLEKKSVHLRIINDKIDFTQYGDETVRQNEIWMPVMRFKFGFFSDAGYRFRENILTTVDHWLPFVPPS